MRILRLAIPLRLTPLVLSLAAASFAAAPAPPHPDGASFCPEPTEEQLAPGNEEQLRQLLVAGLEKASVGGDSRDQNRCEFLLGLSLQLEAERSPEPRRHAALLSAAGWYQKALEISQPGTGAVTIHLGQAGVAVNLARVYSALGQSADAEGLLQAAILNETDSATRQALTISLADISSTTERWRDASKLYQGIVHEDPTDTATWTKLLALLSARAPGELVEAVWVAVKARQPLTAQRSALAAVQDRHLPSGERVSLLAAVVAGLALQYEDLGDLLASPELKPFVALRSDPQLGEAVGEVLNLTQKGSRDPRELRWWREQTDARSPDHSPLAALRSLLRALAQQQEGPDLDSSRAYLKLAEQLNPGVPDPDVYRDLMASYAADGDRDAVVACINRWEEVLSKAPTGAHDTRVLRYRLVAARILHGFGDEGDPRLPASFQYQLARAASEARSTGDPVVFAEVQAMQESWEPYGGGGGGADSRTPNGAHLCDGPPGACITVLLQVPDLQPDSIREAVLSAPPDLLVVVGCAAGSRVLGHTRSRQGALPPAALPVRLIPIPGTAIPGSPHARRISLRQPPRWVISAIWDTGDGLVLADAVPGQLLRYRLDGSLTQVAPDLLVADSPLPLRVRPASSGMFVETTDGSVVQFDRQGHEILHVRLRGRTGAAGTVEGINDWVAADDGLLASVVIRTPRGGWITGVAQFPPDKSRPFDLLDWLPATDPTLPLYRLGLSYLAFHNGTAYYLDLRGPVSLKELRHGRPPRRLATFGEAMSIDADRLLGLDTMKTMQAMKDIVASWRMPTGLLATRDALILLVHGTGTTADPAWQAWTVDPASGRVTARMPIPSTAPELVPVPGDRRWAFLEKSRVERLGLQPIRSILVMPAEEVTSTPSRSAQVFGGH